MDGKRNLKNGKWESVKKAKVLLAGSLILNILFIGIGGYLIHKQGGIAFIKEQVANATSSQKYPDYYVQNKDIFESIRVAKADKIFVGDSITDHGEFQEYYLDQTVLNRGISEDTTDGVLNRIGEVAGRSPKEVYLMIGINDIGAGVEAKTYQKNVEKIIESFDKNSTKVVLQSILPINNRDFNNDLSNKTIHEFNAILQQMAQKYGVDYIDLHTAFEDRDGQLKKDITIDGIHLKGEGYRIWMDKLNNR